ncbi:MAG: hypothetical protein ACLFS3_02185 [Candidatus Aenigmatarchaeota archaeon]
MSCKLCGKDGTLFQAEHKEKGKIMVCRECWKKLYEKNETVTSSSGCGGSCGGCSSCGF